MIWEKVDAVYQDIRTVNLSSITMRIRITPITTLIGRIRTTTLISVIRTMMSIGIAEKSQIAKTDTQ